METTSGQPGAASVAPALGTADGSPDDDARPVSFLTLLGEADALGSCDVDGVCS